MKKKKVDMQSSDIDGRYKRRKISTSIDLENNVGSSLSNQSDLTKLSISVFGRVFTDITNIHGNQATDETNHGIRSQSYRLLLFKPCFNYDLFYCLCNSVYL